MLQNEAPATQDRVTLATSWSFLFVFFNNTKSQYNQKLGGQSMGGEEATHVSTVEVPQSRARHHVS